MVVQWLRFHATNAEGSVPGQETKILHAAGWPKKKKQPKKPMYRGINLSKNSKDMKNLGHNLPLLISVSSL